MDASKLLKEKKFWFATIIVAWAAALQKQESFQRKFVDPLENKDEEEGSIEENLDAVE